MRLSTTRTRNVGLLIDWLAPGYQGDILEGVQRAAEQAGANLLVFFGGAFSDAQLSQPDNAVYALPNESVVDGVVGVLGSLGASLGAEGSGRILRSLGVPCSSLGLDLDGVPSAGVDNEAGLRVLCEHLVTEHRARRFAMIAGPEQSTESKERLEVCRSVLASHGLELASANVTFQVFDIVGGKRGVEELFGNRKLKPNSLDALLCASDLIAEGALEGLSARGVKVPEDVAVTGFDGLDRGQYTDPPLATVTQPLVDLGHAACRALLHQLESLEVPLRQRLASQAVYRSSCGCVAVGERSDGRGVVPPPASAGSTTLLRDRERIQANLARAAAGRFVAAGGGWEERWVHALFSDLTADRPVAFLGELDGVVRRNAGNRHVLEVCERVVAAFRSEALSRVGDPGATRRIEEVMHDTRQLLAGAIERLEVNRRLSSTGTLYDVLHSLERLVRLVGLDGFWAQLRRDLLTIGIHTCIVCKCSGRGAAVSQLRFAFSTLEESWDDLVGREFNTRSLLPEGLVRRPREYPLVVRSLIHGGQVWGTIVFSLSASDVAVYESYASIVALELAVEARSS